MCVITTKDQKKTFTNGAVTKHLRAGLFILSVTLNRFRKGWMMHVIIDQRLRDDCTDIAWLPLNITFSVLIIVRTSVHVWRFTCRVMRACVCDISASYDNVNIRKNGNLQESILGTVPEVSSQNDQPNHQISPKKE